MQDQGLEGGLQALVQGEATSSTFRPVRPCYFFRKRPATFRTPTPQDSGLPLYTVFHALLAKTAKEDFLTLRLGMAKRIKGVHVSSELGSEWILILFYWVPLVHPEEVCHTPRGGLPHT